MSCCEIFRYEEYPRIRVGFLHLDRKRPWPSCLNPETGNQWSADMKAAMLEVLDGTGFEVLRTDQQVVVNDDRWPECLLKREIYKIPKSFFVFWLCVLLTPFHKLSACWNLISAEIVRKYLAPHTHTPTSKPLFLTMNGSVFFGKFWIHEYYA